MLPERHVRMKRILDRRHRSRHVQDQPVWMRTRDIKPIRLEERAQLVVIVLRRTKVCSEFIGAQIPPVVGTLRIGDLAEKLCQLRGIPQRQPDRQRHAVLRRHGTHSLRFANGLWHVIGKRLRRCKKRGREQTNGTQTNDGRERLRRKHAGPFKLRRGRWLQA